MTTSAEQAIAAAIYAPIGLGARLVDDVPVAIDKARQQIATARFIGKFAVDHGISLLCERLTAPSGPAPAVVPPVPTDATEAPKTDPAPATPAPAAPAPDAVDPVVPLLETLALPDYDQLPASQIVNKLDGLTADELRTIEAFELAHRHRRTVLGKIARLAGD